MVRIQLLLTIVGGNWEYSGWRRVPNVKEGIKFLIAVESLLNRIQSISSLGVELQVKGKDEKWHNWKDQQGNNVSDYVFAKKGNKNK